MPKTIDKSPEKTQAEDSHQVMRDINHHLRVIQVQLRRQNSLWHSFIRGAMTGLGATVGVAIVVAIAVFLIVHVARLLGVESAAQSIVDTIR